MGKRCPDCREACRKEHGRLRDVDHAAHIQHDGAVSLTQRIASRTWGPCPKTQMWEASLTPITLRFTSCCTPRANIAVGDRSHKTFWAKLEPGPKSLRLAT